jgi:hypothetical protein
MEMSESRIIAKEGSASAPLVFKLDEFKGRRTFDIRKYYSDRKTGDLSPTRKGISLTRESFSTTGSVLKQFEDEINSWLDGDEVVTQMRVQQQRTDIARKELRFRQYPFTVRFMDLGSDGFFDFESGGGEDTLILNSSHKCFADIPHELNVSVDANSLSAELTTLSIALVSFSKAKQLCDLDSWPILSSMFETLMMNWSLMMAHAIAK